MPQFKTCHLCGETKPLPKFIRDKHKKLGYRGPCKACKRAIYHRRKHLFKNDPSVDSKTCSNCEQTKKSSKFSRNKRSPDGLHPWCKECNRRYLAKYRAKHPPQEPSTDPKTCNSCGETKPASAFRVHKGHVDGLSTRCSKCIRASERKRHHRHPGRKIESNRRWRQDNLDTWNAMNNRRRARKENIPGEYTAEDIQAILADQGNRCRYCDSDISDEYTVDHIIPLSRSGSTNWPENIQLLCRPCNSSKNDRTHDEYLKWLGNQSSDHL